MVERPAAIIAPIYDISRSESHIGAGLRIVENVQWRQNRCFVGVLDETYLAHVLFPRLIAQSFGSGAGEYDFAVARMGHPGGTLYGPAIHPDLRRPFTWAVGLILSPPSATGGARRRTMVVKNDAAVADLLPSGLWELQIAHKGMPLEASLDAKRRRDLLLSLGVEILLLAAIVVIIAGSRRVQMLAAQKMRFAAGVSHELRTPLSAISMLSRNQADGLVAGEKVKEYGELIHQQSRRLNEMVEQVLAYAGMHSGLRPIAKQQVDLERLIKCMLGAHWDELLRRGIQVESVFSPDLPPVSGDERLLRMALENLFTNALKHGDRGQWIRVTAEYVAKEREVRISVEDRGAGIDPADQADIFEPFSRGRAAIEAQIPGSGLGLSLVRSAAEAHRGNVTLVSEPGRGSTFTMHLPV